MRTVWTQTAPLKVQQSQLELHRLRLPPLAAPRRELAAPAALAALNAPAASGAPRCLCGRASRASYIGFALKVAAPAARRRVWWGRGLREPSPRPHQDFRTTSPAVPSDPLPGTEAAIRIAASNFFCALPLLFTRVFMEYSRQNINVHILHCVGPCTTCRRLGDELGTKTSLEITHLRC